MFYVVFFSKNLVVTKKQRIFAKMFLNSDDYETIDYREVLAASVEMALKDHENGNTISHSDFMNRIKEERGWK